MAPKTIPIVALSEMENGQEADLFAMLSAKEELRTRDGKPYYRVAFRDAAREVSFPVWNDSAWFAECAKSWSRGVCYKLRAVYRDTNYGPQLDIRKLRETVDADRADGFDPNMFRAQSRFDPAAMYGELVAIVETRIADVALRGLVLSILETNHEALLTHAAARRNHHAFAGGLIEHTLSVVRTCLFLADKYADYYVDMTPPLDKDLVVAGAVLHDIGKLRELEWVDEGPDYTPSGVLVGHILQGRDMVREAAAGREIDAEKLLRLEHVIVAHQRLPEFGSPKPPMTPEAVLVHYADDIDAKFYMVYSILRDEAGDNPVTTKKNVLAQHVFRGLA